MHDLHRPLSARKGRPDIAVGSVGAQTVHHVTQDRRR